MKKYFENLAKALLNRPFNQLEDTEQKVIESIAAQSPLPEDINEAFHDNLTWAKTG